MNVWNISFDYDGEWIVANSSGTSQGVQDMGLPAHTQRRRLRAHDLASFELAFNIAEHAEFLGADLLLDARRLQREREQLVLPGFGELVADEIHVRRVRRVVLGGRG